MVRWVFVATLLVTSAGCIRPPEAISTVSTTGVTIPTVPTTVQEAPTETSAPERPPTNSTTVVEAVGEWIEVRTDPWTTSEAFDSSDLLVSYGKGSGAGEVGFDPAGSGETWTWDADGRWLVVADGINRKAIVQDVGSGETAEYPLELIGMPREIRISGDVAVVTSIALVDRELLLQVSELDLRSGAVKTLWEIGGVSSAGLLKDSGGEVWVGVDGEGRYCRVGASDTCSRLTALRFEVEDDRLVWWEFDFDLLQVFSDQPSSREIWHIPASENNSSFLSDMRVVNGRLLVLGSVSPTGLVVDEMPTVFKLVELVDGGASELLTVQSLPPFGTLVGAVLWERPAGGVGVVVVDTTTKEIRWTGFW